MAIRAEHPRPIAPGLGQSEGIIRIKLQSVELLKAFWSKQAAVSASADFPTYHGQIDLFVAIRDVGRIRSLNLVFPYLAWGPPLTTVSIDNHINPSAKAQAAWRN